MSRNFVLLLVIIFFTTFASSMASASPVPFLLKALSGTKESFAVFIGVMVSVSSVAIIAANFVGGFLADRFGRRRVIAFGSGILVPGLFAYAIAPSALWVMAIYFVQIFSISISQPAFTALVADMSELDSRGKAFGRFNLFWIGSAVPAPFIGGFLVDTAGLHIPFIAAALLSLVGLAACLGLTDISSREKSTNATSDESDNEKTIMPFTRVMLIFGAVGLLSGLASGLLIPINRLYPIEVLRVSATELGLIYSLGTALVTTIVQIPGGKMTDRFGRKSLMLFSTLGAPFVVALAYTDSLLEFTIASAGIMAFGNIAAPAYAAWQMELVTCSKRAIASGLINAITGIGMFFGPFISIWLYQSQPIVAVAFIVASIPWFLQVPFILKLLETKTACHQQ